MANGESIRKSYKLLEEDIDDLLTDETLSTKELVRGLIRAQRSMLPFLAQEIENTRRVTVMWAVFRPAVVAGGALLTLITGFLWGIFTGEIEVTPK